MAQKRGRATATVSAKSQRWVGLCGVALGVFLLASLLTFNPVAYRDAASRGEVFFPFADALGEFAAGSPGITANPVSTLYHNAGGGLGLWLATVFLRVFGWIGVWIVPAAFLVWGFNRLLSLPSRSLLLSTLFSIPITGGVTAMASAVGLSIGWTGAFGTGIWNIVRSGVGPAGGILVLAVGVLGFVFGELEVWDKRHGAITRTVLRRTGTLVWALILLLGRSVKGVFDWIRRRPWESGVSIDPADEPLTASGPRRLRAASTEPEPEPEWTPPKIVNHDVEDRMPLVPPVSPPSAPRPVSESIATRAVMPPPERATAPPPVTESHPADGPAIPDAAPARPESASPLSRPVPSFGTPAEEKVAVDLTHTQDVEAAVREARRLARPGKKKTGGWPAMKGKMVVPTVDVLDDVPDSGPSVPEEELEENSKILTQTLSDFGISGKVGEIHPGPVITRYEYVPGPGIKVSQILNRQDDLALKLKASRIRILAPIPGKAAVGIEVPNRNPAPIFLRRILETRAFNTASGPLPLALGKDISGAPVTTELSKMPHLLIAGTTGSGKSVCMNALITSLLMKRTPAELRMIMIDPKMLELPIYNGIPHLLTEVVTDSKVAARCLKWALIEMETRYKMLSKRGCRNLQSYNAKVEREGPREEGEEKLPYIVILIDELADLMLTSGKEVEEPIARLAQLARAVGMHLIVATQRPSVDVITGVIKANFPCRIGFQVASKTDSRTILDQNGAESLLGKGDMLFLPPGQAAPHRVHGAFVSEEETQRLAQVWRDQGEPTECPGLNEVLTEPEAGGGALGDDPLFEEAARLVVAVGQASASLLQRRLKVGYARAARLVDMLESAGVVSPQDGSKARDILVDEVRLEHVLVGMDE